MPTLYVTEQGARLEKEYKRILVTLHDEVLMAVPVARLSEVVLVGWIGATTPALMLLLDAGVPLSFVTRAGKLRGRLAPPLGKNIPLRHAQYDRARDAGFCLRVSRSIVLGKLRNARALAYRLCRRHPDCDIGDIDPIERAIQKASRATKLSTLRGVEGMAARAYFGLYRRALRPEMTFQRRSRRPPRDPANALLSLGYTLLTQNMVAACEVVGLDPYDGFFHADKYGRPALALDLVEEFRSVVVDSIVQTTINKKIIGPADFTSQEGCYLKGPGLRRFLQQYSHRLNATVACPRANRALSYQKIFEVQARSLAKVIQGRLDKYQPFRIR